MAADYYLILGVASDATQEQIKAAYREKAKELHPDHFSGGSGPFRAVQEAYEVLSDPTRRRTYDEALARESLVGRPGPRIRTEPLRPQHPSPEPLIPTQRTSARQGPLHGAAYHTLFEELFGRAWVRPEPRRMPNVPRHPDDIHLRVSLTREQATRGGRVRFSIPTRVSCPACRGLGSMGLFLCPQCRGHGAFVDDYPLEIAFPAGVKDGSTWRLALDIPGSQDTALTLQFSVRPW